VRWRIEEGEDEEQRDLMQDRRPIGGGNAGLERDGRRRSRERVFTGGEGV